MQLTDSEEKQRRLVRMRRVAGGLLVGATLVFVLAYLAETRRPDLAWIGYVRAAAEAAMVGGVADWFAVTALFRHPWGLPIPHTAIIPRRKDRIGRSLGNFVEHNFLAPELLGARLRGARLGRRAAEWLADPEHSRTLAGHAAAALRGASAVVRDEDVHALLDRSVIAPLRRTPIAPVLAQGLTVLTLENRHQELLDRVLNGLARLVAENDGVIRQRIAEEAPWWIPDAAENRIHDKLVGAIERTLAEVAVDPEHPMRRRFDDFVVDFIARLQESPTARARAEEIKLRLLDDPTSRRLAASLWLELRSSLAPAGDAHHVIERGLVALGEAMLRDEALMAKMDEWITAAVLEVVDQHRHEAGNLIAQTVSAWDPAETSRRIELQVGRDLQFIRINGTLVGALVGVLLHLVTRLIDGGL
jgi:uncharacterized membrane-anchored protein YjiN (DUF445 family)